jgi:predicted ribosomally synthesized six-cysteine peptide SCIFF
LPFLKTFTATGEYAIIKAYCFYHSQEARHLEKKHIMTFNANIIKELKEDAGCGECQSSCQSACKTSCTVANQSCLKDQKKK